MRLVKTAAEHPVSVLMVYTAILIFGLVSFVQLPQELLPDLSLPMAQVVCEYEGLPAAEIETLITGPVENALSAVKGVRSISSVSMDGLASVKLGFDWSINQDRAAVEIREKIDGLYPFLPFGAGKPLVFATEESLQRPVMTLAVVPARGREIQDISAIVRGELSAKLQQVPGIAAVRIVGLTEAEIAVEVDGTKLTAAGIALPQLTRIVASSIYRVPLGSVLEGAREYQVEATTGIETPQDIRRIPVPTAGGGVVPLGHFARVYRDIEEPTSFFHHDARKAIGIFVDKIPGSGSLNTARRLKNALSAYRTLFAGDMNVRIIDDPTEEIAAGIRNLLMAMGFGIVAVILILLVIFRKPAAPLVVSASIPTSMAVVFLFMRLTGIGLNLVSLAGIAIGIGMIVDNSIVVLDTLIRQRAHGAESIAAAAATTVNAIVGSTFTTILVFIPVVFLPGVTGALFGELALTISCLLLASLGCALTLTPALYSLCFRPTTCPQANDRLMGTIGSIYEGYLRKELTRPCLTFWLVAGLVLAGLGALFVLPKNVFPVTDTHRLEIQVGFPAAIPIGEAESLSRNMAGRIGAIDGIQSVFASAGFDRRSPSDRGDPEKDPRHVHFRVTADAGVNKSTAGLTAEIEHLLSRYPGVRFTVNRPSNAVRRLLGDTDAVVYRLVGADRGILLEEAESIAERLEDARLVQSAWLDTRREANRIELDLDPIDLAAQGVEPAIVLETLRTAVRGQIAAQVSERGRRVPVRVRLDPQQTANETQLARVHVAARAGLVEIGTLGSVERSTAYQRLYRVDRTPAVSLTVLPSVGSKSALVDFLSSRGEARGEVLLISALQRNQRHILVVFGFALLLMYLMIGAQFESFLLPLLLLLTLLPAFSGSLITLLLCGYSFNINSFLGMLILAGTAINISIILTVAIQSVGPIDRDALILACTQRLTPIAATALSTMAAMIPIALITSGEGAPQSHTAVALLGGLFFAMVSILLIYPVMADRFYSLKRVRR